MKLEHAWLMFNTTSTPYQGHVNPEPTIFQRPNLIHILFDRAGDKIPHIKLLDVQSSRELSLADEVFQDKILVIDFWATWSGPCEVISPLREDASLFEYIKCDPQLLYSFLCVL